MLQVKRSPNGTEYMISTSNGVAYRKDGTPIAVQSIHGIEHLPYWYHVGNVTCLFAWQRGEIDQVNHIFNPFVDSADSCAIHNGALCVYDTEFYLLAELHHVDSAAREYVAECIAAMELRLQQFRNTASQFGF